MQAAFKRIYKKIPQLLSMQRRVLPAFGHSCLVVMVMDSWWPWKSSGQGIGLWLACYEFEPSTTKDPPCKGAR
ncbi:UNVERIFIED_CONTAM: hypothetical protein NCL1_08590 [Trichonephila clavipes]